MYKNKILANSVRLALISGAATAAFTSPVVFAVDDEDKVERIEVTGSRIKRTDIEGANPVTILDRQEIVDLGITDVGELIQRLPSMNGAPIATTTNNGGSGAVTVDLRGLGSIRTLVLINGRRTVDGGDFQTIPASMIQQVEILKDGASAVYGADAVAGVVNIITRSDFDGVEVSVQRKDWTEASGDSQNDMVSLIGGKTFDGGHITFGAEYNTQEGIFQGQYDVPHFKAPYYVVDRESFEANGLVPGDNVVALGSSRIPNGVFKTAGGELMTLKEGGDPTKMEDYRAYNGDVFDPNNDTYNYAPVNYLQTPYERANVFIETKFDVAEDTQFFASLRGSQRTSAQQLAPVPYDSRFDPGFINEDGFSGISADSYYNPFGEDIVDARRRIVEGNRRFEQDVLQIQSVAGFEGVIAEEWEWSAAYNWGYRARTDIDKGQLVASNLEKALGPSFMDTDGVVKCGSAGNVIDGCVPLNMFGEGNITQDMLDYVQAELVDKYTTQQDMFNLNLTNSYLFELPAGFVGVSVGYEYRREGFEYTPDSNKAKETVSGNTGGGTAGSYVVNSYYGEAIVPLLADLPAVDLLELNLGLRYDDFSSFGGNSTYQAGLKWRPYNDLLVRATFGEVFRAPTVSELYSPQADSFDQAADPCNTENFGSLSAEGQALCVASGVPSGGYAQTDTQVRARVGGNPDLQPEQGDTFTAGIAFEPEFIPGLNLTVDYWKVELDDLISRLGAEELMDQCYRNLNTAVCSQITRLPGGNINNIAAVNLNLAKSSAGGIDTEIVYNLETGFGDWRASLGWTHLLEREDTPYAGAEAIDLIGILDPTSSGQTAYPEDKATLGLDWKWEDWSVSYSGEYISSIEAEYTFVEGIQKVDSQFYHDIGVNYDFVTQTRVSVGMTNITDEDAPYIDAAFNASTIPELYRVNGRGYFVRLVQKF
ncbi:MAG: TonB-dependent receptor [Shewanella sp.]|nr:TonB-dependent receptor [Shewanella sp.]MCF1431763.1 TonB-dependent receptor [Shewanella sp.]MCF1437309.1 TonB-dependent receptor [Shewanella sp.]MCF1456454.1 TonB-dependent receptor [Shewanella sp.]